MPHASISPPIVRDWSIVFLIVPIKALKSRLLIIGNFVISVNKTQHRSIYKKYDIINLTLNQRKNIKDSLSTTNSVIKVFIKKERILKYKLVNNIQILVNCSSSSCRLSSLSKENGESLDYISKYLAIFLHKIMIDFHYFFKNLTVNNWIYQMDPNLPKSLSARIQPKYNQLKQLASFKQLHFPHKTKNR